MKPKTIILICVAMLVVLGILAAVVLGTDLLSNPTYETRIQNAEKYLNEGDLDQAILEYKAAIEMDGDRPEAYLALAALYRGNNLNSLARQTLEQGLSRTNNDTLRAALAENESVTPAQPSDVPSTPTEAPPEKDPENRDPVLNVELLQFLSGATYQDYKNRYSDLRVSYSGGQCTVRTGSIPADILFYDTATLRVVNTSTQEPYPECVPNEIRFDNICLIFGGVKQVELNQLRRLGGVMNIRETGSGLEFEANGCKFQVTCSDSTITPDSANQLVPTGTVNVMEHVVSGTVVDAASGLPVADAHLIFNALGVGDVAEIDTESDGSYSVGVPSGGEYSIEVSKDGYITESFSVYVPDGARELSANFTISPPVDEDVIRIVLTWTAVPSDMDSYLMGDGSDGTSTFIYFGSRSQTDSSGSLIAELDVDDMDGYGPETITLYDIHGDFTYCVADYTGTVGVGGSEAEVKIYKGNSLIDTVRPSSGIGFGWEVLRIHDGEITIVNQDYPTTSGRLK